MLSLLYGSSWTLLGSFVGLVGFLLTWYINVQRIYEHWGEQNPVGEFSKWFRSPGPSAWRPFCFFAAWQKDWKDGGGGNDGRVLGVPQDFLRRFSSDSCCVTTRNHGMDSKERFDLGKSLYVQVMQVTWLLYWSALRSNAARYCRNCIPQKEVMDHHPFLIWDRRDRIKLDSEESRYTMLICWEGRPPITVVHYTISLLITFIILYICYMFKLYLSYYCIWHILPQWK